MCIFRYLDSAIRIRSASFEVRDTLREFVQRVGIIRPKVVCVSVRVCVRVREYYVKTFSFSFFHQTDNERNALRDAHKNMAAMDDSILVDLLLDLYDEIDRRNCEVSKS